MTTQNPDTAELAETPRGHLLVAAMHEKVRGPDSRYAERAGSIKMKGSIYKSTSSAGRTTWRYQIDAGRDENGQRVRPGQSGFRLEREADTAMHAKMAELKGGFLPAAGTLKAYIDQWLPYHA